MFSLLSICSDLLNISTSYLSAGLNVDPVLRLDNQGDVFLNVGFGTGVYDGVKIFDGDLKEFELADVKINKKTYSYYCYKNLW